MKLKIYRVNTQNGGFWKGSFQAESSMNAFTFQLVTYRVLRTLYKLTKTSVLKPDDNQGEQ